MHTETGKTKSQKSLGKNDLCLLSIRYSSIGEQVFHSLAVQKALFPLSTHLICSFRGTLRKASEDDLNKQVDS